VIDFNDLIRICCVNPAHILGLSSKGAIEVGYDADLVLFDPKESYEVSNTHSLYYGETLHGKVKKVIVAGKLLLN